MFNAYLKVGISFPRIVVTSIRRFRAGCKSFVHFVHVKTAATKQKNLSGLRKMGGVKPQILHTLA